MSPNGMSLIASRADSSATIWERLWQYAPPVQRDDALLARERRSPRWKRIIERLHHTFGGIEGLRTIELGAGRGDWSCLLAEEGARVVLLDGSRAALHQARNRFARRKLTAEFIEADLFLPTNELAGTFDLALSSGVIEHFAGQQRTAAIRAHRQMLSNGGMAIISVPHARCLPYRFWKFYLERRGWWPYGVEIPYSRRELVRRAEQAGLDDLAVVTVGFWQSIGDHWCRNLFHIEKDWGDRRSMWDRTMGMSAILFGTRPPW